MRTRLGSLLILAGSCGPASPMDATGSTGHTSAATSSTTGPTSTDAVTGTTSTAATSTGGETGVGTSTGGETGEGTSTGGETGEASVTVATTDATTVTTTTGESSTGEPSGVVYAAEYYGGQINRITVYRADFDADNCAVIKFSETGSDPDVPVTLPPFWQVDWTQITQGTASCFGGQPGPLWEQADSVMGMADFDLSMACLIDIDVTATFPQTRPWVPMDIQFLATALPVEGFC